MSHPLDFWRGGVLSSLRDTQFQRAVDRLFEDWSHMRSPKGELAGFPVNPSCEVTETKSEYQVKVDLPGVQKDQIKIDLHDGVLTISGERKEERKEDDKKRHFTECYYGSFSRSFSFPIKVDSERVDAKFDSGVLTISVPKTESSRARQISIK